MADNAAERAEEILRKAEDRLTQLEAAGLDVRSLHKKLEKAKQLDIDERYEDVIKTTEEILVVAKIARDEVQTSLSKVIGKGKTEHRPLMDERKVKEVVAQALQEEIDKFIHSKSLRAMFETIAREEAEEQVGKLSKTIEKIDSRTEKLTETVGAKADGAALEALQAAVDDQISELLSPEDVNATVASAKEELGGKIDGLPLLSKDDVSGIVEKALADAGYAVAADIATELASTEDELDDRISALSKELKDKLSSMPKITEQDVDTKVDSKVAELKAEVDALKGELDEKMSALATTDKLNSKIAALEHETNNKLLNLPRVTVEDVKRIVAEAVEAAPKPETLTPEQIERMVSEKENALDERVSALDERISGLPTTTPDEINHIVAEALRSAEFASPGDVDAKIASLKEAVDNKLSSAPALTEEDVRRIAAEAVPNVEAGPSTEQVESLVAEKIAGIEIPAPRSRADIENIITEVLAQELSPLESKLSALESGLEERIDTVPTMSKDEVDRTVADALRSADFASANDIESKIASLRQEFEARPAVEPAGPSLTEDDVKRIAAEAAPQFSEDDLRRIIGDVVSDIEIPSAEQMESIVAGKIAGIEIPSQRSRADTENIITEVLAQKLSPLESKFSALESGLEERIDAVPTMSKDEVDRTMADALRSADFASAKDIESKIASLRQEFEARPAVEPAGPSLTEDDVKRIAAEAVPKVEGGPSTEQIESLVSGKIAGIEIPSQRSRADIENIITEVLAQKLSPLESKLSAFESAQAEKEAAAPAVSPDDISRLVSDKLAGVLRALREKLA